MNLIWDILPFAIYLVGSLMAAVLGGAIVGGRLSRSWLAKAAPRLLALGLLVLLLAPKPPPVAAAVLGYSGFAVFAAGWLLKGRTAIGVHAVGLAMLVGAQFWMIWTTAGVDKALRLGLELGALSAFTLAIFAVADWRERRANARTGEGA